MFPLPGTILFLSGFGQWVRRSSALDSRSLGIVSIFFRRWSQHGNRDSSRESARRSSREDWTGSGTIGSRSCRSGQRETQLADVRPDELPPTLVEGNADLACCPLVN